MRILLVEDERRLSGYIAKGLQNSGYAVDAVYDGEAALYEYGVNSYDLIILDLNLPKVDGLDVLREIRKTDGSIKVIILSARSKVSDRILGLDDGANDYLIKPFDFGELEARIRNLLRREFLQVPSIVSGRPEPGYKSQAGHIPWYRGRFDTQGVRYSGVPDVHQNQVISAEELTEHIWNNTFDPFSNTVRYHIHSLKKKLHMACRIEYIKTIRGQGYIMEAPQ